jgi:hypothetical protein
MSSNQLTGNVGLYFVCYRLSQCGWNAIPTSRNARGIDVVAYNAAGDCKLLQVKTVSRRNAVSLGTSLENITGDFWIIVALGHGDGPICFVMLPTEVKQRATTDEGGKQASWLAHKDFFLGDEFRERWDRIGG